MPAFADIDFSDTNIRIATRRGMPGSITSPLTAFGSSISLERFPANDLIAVLNPATTYAGFTAARFAGGDGHPPRQRRPNLPGAEGTESFPIDPGGARGDRSRAGYAERCFAGGLASSGRPPSRETPTPWWGASLSTATELASRRLRRSRQPLSRWNSSSSFAASSVWPVR